MGKVLIIKGADFSEVAVAHEIVEPTEYINVGDNYGTNGYSSYSEGAFYFRCQNGIDHQSSAIDSSAKCGLFEREDNTGVRPTLEGGEIVKIGNLYYTIGSEGYKITPYYGISSVPIELQSGAYKFVDSSTAPTVVTNTALKSSSVNLTGGKSYVLYGSGGSSFTLAIVKKANNTYVNLGDGLAFNYVEYTAEAGDVLYFSINYNASTHCFVGVLV